MAVFGVVEIVSEDLIVVVIADLVDDNFLLVVGDFVDDVLDLALAQAKLVERGDTFILDRNTGDRTSICMVSGKRVGGHRTRMRATRAPVSIRQLIS